MIFHRNLEGIIERLGDLNRDGRNYWLGYVTALKEEGLVTVQEFEMMASLILWQENKKEVKCEDKKQQDNT